MIVIFIRTLIIFLSLIVLMRILGKRQLGELELSELVVSVLIANMASMPLQDIGIPLMNGLLPVIILFCCELILSGLTMRSVRLRALICGKPCVLIRNGKIQQRMMRECRFTIDELTEELRGKNINDLSTVRYAILETDGTLNAILYAEHQAPTSGQLGLTPPELGYAYVIVEEGRVLADNLKKSGHDENWLKKQLESRGVSGAQDVYLLIVYDGGQVYFAGKDGK